MKKIYFILFGIFFLFSCEKIDEDVVEITGIYQANIQGVSGPHTISVAYDRGDEIVIEAPFDGFEWIYIYADVDNQEDFIKNIDIYQQEIGPGIFIWGEGYYNDGTIQLDYTIEFNPFEIYDFRLVGSRY
jgi:hypothetical protein